VRRRDKYEERRLYVELNRYELRLSDGHAEEEDSHDICSLDYYVDIDTKSEYE
jgi:hypothetical protein